MGKISRRYFFITSNVLITLLALSAFLAMPNLGIKSEAMGSAPGTCRNLYNDTFVSFTINNGTQTFNPLTNSGVMFEADKSIGYNVTFSLQAANQGQSGNTSSGQVWYVTDYPNGYFGFCINVTGPDALVNDSIHITQSSGNENPGPVVWGNLSSYQINYTTDWVSRYNVTATDASGNQLSGLPLVLYYEGQDVASNRTVGTEVANGSSPAQFTLQWGTSYVIKVENGQNYVFSHWADTGSTNSTRTISYNENGDVALDAVFVPNDTTTTTMTSNSTTTSTSSSTATSSGSTLSASRTLAQVQNTTPITSTTSSHTTHKTTNSNKFVFPFQLPETDIIIVAIAGVIITTGTITALKLRRH
jgi:hypothetical protein